MRWGNLDGEVCVQRCQGTDRIYGNAWCLQGREGVWIIAMCLFICFCPVCISL